MSEYALIPGSSGYLPALQNAIRLWADASTDAASSRRRDLLRDKQLAVRSFFEHTAKHPAEITPLDIKTWQRHLEEERRLLPATVYAMISRISAFYQWAMRHPELSQAITSNPVQLARPKAPRAYQNEKAKAFDDDQLRRLLAAVRRHAEAGTVVGKRDYALLLFYVLTGMRRNEIISLRGKDVERTGDGGLLIRCKVKGGDYVGREVRDASVRDALFDYLAHGDRMIAFDSDRPLWTRHDRAGKPGAALSSHAFAKNFKRYAVEAGIGDVHLHQTRHTYARIVAEDTGSIIETQDALGHKNLATTRVYVGRVAIKRDKHSERITRRLNG